jgi:hypothetical protein
VKLLADKRFYFRNTYSEGTGHGHKRKNIPFAFYMLDEAPIMKFLYNLVWWYWAATTILLIGVVAGNAQCLQAVIALNALQVIHFMFRERSLTAFPVQVRIAYFGLLFLAQVPFMFWIFWWQLTGTSAMVLFEYCFLARCLSFLPWNKKETYSLEMIKHTFASPPVKGNILQGLAAIPGRGTDKISDVGRQSTRAPIRNS